MEGNPSPGEGEGKMSVPLLSDLLKYLGAVPTIFISLGFLFVGGGGVLKELSWTNKPFLFGFLLIFFGLTVFYGGIEKLWLCHRPGAEYCSDHEYDARRHLHVESGPLTWFLLYLGGCIVLAWLLIFGPWWRTSAAPSPPTASAEAALSPSPPPTPQKQLEPRKKESAAQVVRTIVLEARLTCELRPGAELPPGEVPFLPVGDASAYLEGAAGRARLSFVSPIVFRHIEGDRLVVINRFLLDPSSDLVGRPVGSLQNFATLKVPIITVGSSSALMKMRVLEISVALNEADPIYASYQYDDPFQAGPVFNVPLGPFLARLK
jgi:hypothetical protein